MLHGVRWSAAVAAGVLLLGGCASSEEEPEEVPPIGGEQEPEPVEPEPEPEDEGNDEDASAEDDPYALPDGPEEIDEEYVERVVNRLLEIQTEAVLLAMEQSYGETLDVEVVDRLAATSEGDRLNSFMRNLQDNVHDQDGWGGYLEPDEIEPSRLEVDLVLHREPEQCVIVVGWWDLTTVSTNAAAEDDKSVFSLSRVDREVTTEERNPTPWQFRHIAALHDTEGEPIAEEYWEDLEFGDQLDHACEREL